MVYNGFLLPVRTGPAGLQWTASAFPWSGWVQSAWRCLYPRWPGSPAHTTLSPDRWSGTWRCTRVSVRQTDIDSGLRHFSSQIFQSLGGSDVSVWLSMFGWCGWSWPLDADLPVCLGGDGSPVDLTLILGVVHSSERQLTALLAVAAQKKSFKSSNSFTNKVCVWQEDFFLKNIVPYISDIVSGAGIMNITLIMYIIK